MTRLDDLIIEHHGPLDAGTIDTIREHLRSHGATLVRCGASAGMADFDHLTSAIGTDFIAYDFADRDYLDSTDKTLRSVTLGQHEIPLHAEFSDMPCRPEIGCLYCIEPAPQGGESTMCDGVAVANALSPATRRAVTERRFLYFRVRNPARAAYDAKLAANISRIASEFPKPILGTFEVKPADDPVLYSYAISPIVKCLSGEGAFCTHICRVLVDPNRKLTFEDGAPLEPAMLDEIVSVIAAHKLSFTMRAGDMMLFDNMRWMHGRSAFTGKRVIATRFGFMK